ncbi:PREDICTED: crossover junction endonuclease MUS81 [Ceratosolen solmsi marchali]|uniref:Crossover junction endonuclease MUS81 n=1 Tax=Ceratosolen solmsi marchali TaxID=326594 RepID=A0AAJ6YRK9_9HYME|nr:PREDICTED: crossover junction endonuclease MUS81 [Ceratosolen solmsi marchali]
MKRIRKYPETPNPLFEKWLEEWKEMAAAKDLPIQYAFGKALSSLRKYPLPLATGKECYILNHFGHKLCCMLDKKLAEYNNLHNISSTYKQNISLQNNSKTIQNKSNKIYIPKIGSPSYAILITMYKNMKKPNYPGFMYKNEIISQAQSECEYPMKTTASQHYAGWSSMSLLITKNLILKKSNPAKYSLTDTGVSLAISLQKARENISSDSSDENAGLSNSLLNVKESLNSLIASSLKSKSNTSKSSEDSINDLLHIEKAPLYLDLTTSNLTDSIKSSSVLNNDHENIKEIDDIIKNVPLECNTKKKIGGIQDRKRIFTKDDSTDKQNKKIILIENTSNESFYLLPNNFDIILLVDTQETSGGKMKMNNNEKISELSKSGILFEVRRLGVGDFMWIARCKFTNRELVLPYIVERKRIDDFSSSIKDGRYHEQKYRLKESGIRNVIYMIESYGKNYHGAIPLTSLFQAAMNTLVQDDFNVKFTQNHKDSLHYLITITAMLTEIYEGKELNSCKKEDLPLTNYNIHEGLVFLMEFTLFNKASMKPKNFNVREIFVRQLLQLKGMSLEKALAIVELYSTPVCLTEALIKGEENLLANIVAGPTKRKLGHVISKTIYQLYTKYDFD